MRLVLNYSVKDMQNDVRQKIHIYIISIELTSVGLTHAHPN